MQHFTLLWTDDLSKSDGVILESEKNGANKPLLMFWNDHGGEQTPKDLTVLADESTEKKENYVCNRFFQVFLYLQNGPTLCFWTWIHHGEEQAAKKATMADRIVVNKCTRF